MVNLSPCPFCGGPAEFEEIPEVGARTGVTWSVGCGNADEEACPGYQLMTSWPTKGAAASAWNRRSPDLENAPAGLADAHTRSPEPTIATQSERIAALEAALRLAKDMFIANGLDLPHTMEVIDDALEGRRARALTEGGAEHAPEGG